MLTPSKIKNHHFEASGKNAYRAQSVDDFFDIVADSYEQMFKENGELVKKISLLAERVEEYRNDEDNIRAALLTAQRMADQIMRETNEKADAQLAEAATSAKKTEAEAAAKARDIIDAAQAKANQTLIDAANTAKRLIEDATVEAKEQSVIARDRMIKTQAALGLVQQEADKFKSELLSLYSEHIELISRIPEIQEEEADLEPVEEAAPVVIQVEEEPTEEPVAEIPVVEEAEEEPVEEVIEQVLIQEDEIEDPVEEEDIAVAVEEAPAQEEEEISDEKLRDLGFDVPVKAEEPVFFERKVTREDASPKVIFSADDEDEDVVESSDVEADDDYGEDDGVKFNLNFKFSTADDHDEFYDDEDDDDDDYYDDEDDDDDNNGSFGSKLKGFFKR